MADRAKYKEAPDPGYGVYCRWCESIMGSINGVIACYHCDVPCDKTKEGCLYCSIAAERTDTRKLDEEGGKA